MLPRSMRKFALVLLLAACATSHSSSSSLTFRSLQSGQEARQHTAGTRAVAAADDATYRRLWDQLIGGNPALIDLSKESAIFLLGGEKPTGGHSVQVLRVTMEGDVANVWANVNEPPAGSINTQVITYPFTVIAIAKPGVTQSHWQQVR